MVAFLTHEKKALLLALSKIKTPLTPSETRPNVLQTVLLAINEGGRGAFGKDMMTVLVLFDFSKTFDSIPHKKLLTKLIKCKCSDRPLKWFLTYLYGRVPAVADEGGSVSAWLKTLDGVRQGSVLGFVY